MANILVVDDEAPLRQSMVIALKREGHQTTEASGAEAALRELAQDSYDLAIVDLRLGDGDGLSVIKSARVQSTTDDTSFIVVTAYGTVETAVEAMRRGADDFIEKPFGPERLVASVTRALQHRRLKAELRRRAGSSTSELVGATPTMAQVRQRIVRAADAKIVLVTGETGAGKEVVARAVHGVADADAPFVVINCGALPAALIESELFGHTRGAFTGAGEARRGLLAEADGGTAFLDEVGEIPLDLQPRLLRFLESGETRRVGADRSSRIDCRIIAATNRSLAEEVAAGRFRQDLLYRLDVFRISVPPLRDRLDDIEPLATHLIDRICRRLRRPPPSLVDGGVPLLRGHSWPGNVRELDHVLERAMLLTSEDPIPLEILAESIEEAQEHKGSPATLPAPTSGDGPPTLADVERGHILSVLESCSGDRASAAQLLGISRSTLRRKLIAYGMWNPS